MKELNAINPDIVIDFELPPTLQNLLEEAEQYNREGNFAEYVGIPSNIDVLCKGYVRNGYITQEQWDLLCEKYPEI